MLCFRSGSILILVLLLCCRSVAYAGPEHDQGIAVQVKKSGETILVDVSFTVQATSQEAWNVLTDFDHMAQFVSNLQSSRITDRVGNKIQVEQKGKTSHGVFSFAFDSLRELELNPYQEIRSRLISGSMKRLDGTTVLSADGAGTRIVYHGESVPNVWVPPLVGTAFIENEMRIQFQEMQNEILKRKGAEKK